MERYGKSYISPKYTIEDYINLNLGLESTVDDWEKALDIFNSRLEERYFNVIYSLLDDVYSNGFAIMALECLLIETFYQFREGFSVTPSGKNKESYGNFLRKSFPEVFDSSKAERFYTDIRCGILHSAQTKNGSQLTYKKSYVVELFDGGRKIRVDVKRFADIVWDYYKGYVDALKIPEERYLRENFIKKMNYICRIEH